MIKRLIRKVASYIKTAPAYGWSGNYKSWDTAKSLCSGYDKENILAKVKEATWKVKTGEAEYERDSVLFDKIEYSFPLAAFLLWTVSEGRPLNLIDFGGSLGSTYYQNKFFLGNINRISWNIVEQKSFVDIGKEMFQDKNLQFFYTVDECINSTAQKIDTIIFSSVLQYLPAPYEMLSEILQNNFKHIIIDITTIHEEEYDRIAIQNVPPAIYTASYPTWFFSERRFVNFFEEKGYRLVSDWNLPYSINIGKHKGYFFIK